MSYGPTVNISYRQLVRGISQTRYIPYVGPYRPSLGARCRVAAFSTFPSDRQSDQSSAFSSKLDKYITTQLTCHYKRISASDLLTCSYKQYRQNANLVLDQVLPSESAPLANRRADTERNDGEVGDGMVLVIHATEVDGQVKYTSCSGFVIRTENPSGRMVVTCAHTLEEIEYRHPSTLKRSFILLPSSSSLASNTDPIDPLLIPIKSIPTSLPRADILICRLPDSTPPNLRSLPVSPYPLSRDNNILVHCFGASDPPLPRISVSQAKGEEDQPEPISWLGGMGWRRWVEGRLLGYRGDLWEEVEAGTADSLPYILTSPLPSPGSSGGPIVDSLSGSVVGVISGTRMDNRIEGERGWGASAENIFELFSLPGFTPVSKRTKP